MPAALGLAVARLLPWILAWFALGGNIKSVEKNIESFGQSITAGPINAATNAWVKVAVIAAGLGIGVWLLETKIAKGMGQELDAPPVESIHVAAPPTFGASSGFSAGPYRQTSTVQGHSGSAGSAGNPGRRSASAPPPPPPARPVSTRRAVAAARWGEAA